MASMKWTSGATGFWLSNPVAKKFAEAWPDFRNRHKAEALRCYCPDVITGELLQLLGFSPTRMPDWYATVYVVSTRIK